MIRFSKMLSEMREPSALEKVEQEEVERFTNVVDQVEQSQTSAVVEETDEGPLDEMASLNIRK
jgi:hypothetical protein